GGTFTLFYLFFEPPRRAHRAKLTCRVYHDVYCVVNSGCPPTNARDKRSRLDSADANGIGVAGLTHVTDIDIAISCSDISARVTTQSDVNGASSAHKRVTAKHRAAIASRASCYVSH